MTNDEILQILKDRETELEHEVNHYKVMKSFEGDEKQQMRFSLLHAESKVSLRLCKKTIAKFEDLNDLANDIEKELNGEYPDLDKLLTMFVNLKRGLRDFQ
ncbi:hypothetical protein [Clostridium beijerinckii]|uniref:hypothetical protein n=1 Tax=Clostridium beijerinckii TaxID=1520 RepID=UPI00149446B8|nr:hypothetical protein [Clostridium beijerinckii]NOW08071.1 hypothetical protein [Clostridium beijerinckii]NYC05653.1 hypothetical protein [Clostridium beijerinckii]